MTRTWIVVAHRSGAKFYARTGAGPIELVREVLNPGGHLKDHEIVTDRTGRSNESGTSRRSAVGTDHPPTQVAAETFARSLASMLDSARVERTYERLVLMAEPRFLGMLREALDPHTAAAVAGTVAKDLPRATESEVRLRLDDVIWR